MKKRFLILFAMCMMFTGLLLFNNEEVNAATPSVESFSFQKVYSSFDITNDGQLDSLYVTGHYNKTYQTYDSCYVYINGYCKLYVPISEDCYAIKEEIITLENNMKYLLLRFMGDDDDQTCNLYQYQSNQLVNIVNFDTIFGNSYGCHYSIFNIRVTGNTIGIDFNYMSSTLGMSTYYYTYSYKNGAIVKDSNTGKITSIYHEKGKISNNCKLKKKVKVYKGINKSSKTTLKKNKTVKVVNVYYTAKEGMWLKIKYGSKYGWIKASKTSNILFKNMFYAG